MSRKRLIWVDIGMVIAVAIFLGLALFTRDLDGYLFALVAYIVGLVIFAGTAEFAAMRVETGTQPERVRRTGDRHRSALPH